MNNLVNMSSPVNWGHPLNRGLVFWGLVTPGTYSGTRFTDLTNPGSSGNHGTLSGSSSDGPPAWQGTNRPGGWGHLKFDGGTTEHLIKLLDHESLDFDTGDFAWSFWYINTDLWLTRLCMLPT